jgi:hypothetical protein
VDGIATLQLTKVWINQLSDGAAVSAQSAPQRARGHDVAGEVRTYAGGRQRAVTTAGERGKFVFALMDVTLPTVEVLRSWIRHPVQVRDHRGQRFVGVYFAIDIMETRDAGLYNVAIDLRTLTTTEGV